MKNQITVFLIMFGLLLWVIQVVNLNRGKENNNVCGTGTGILLWRACNSGG